MVKLTIDNRAIEVPAGTTILEAAKQAKIHIPTLCYYKDLNEIGACRVCVVEVEGKDQLVAACNTPAADDMEIRTNSPAVRAARRNNVELILSQHKVECTSCVRGDNCTLRDLSNMLGVVQENFDKKYDTMPWPQNFPLIRDNSKCIKCMRCIQVCDNIQSLNVWDVAYPGTQATVKVHHNKPIEQANCSLCGQCITHCPVGALHERDDIQQVIDAITDPEITTVVQIAPAIRTAWGEAFHMTPEEATVERLGAVLKHMGFDYVFDTTFSADLTIMEEGSEFLEFIQQKNPEDLPMFTSCCPGWVRFTKLEFPELADHLSTAKSPQQMFGAVTKNWFAKQKNLDPKKVFSVSIMPCLAKKEEAALPSMKNDFGTADVDVALTTRELDRMVKSDFLDPRDFEEIELDSPLGTGSGAGVIFGATGGVMEAALRTAYYLVNGKNPEPDHFKAVRGQNGRKEVTIELGGKPIRAAVVSGLANTRQLIEDLKDGKCQFDFVEIMACPGGCVGGGGQPICDGEEMAARRAPTLYKLDMHDQLRFSHENPSIQEIYREYYRKPLSELAHHQLHTVHNVEEL